MTTSRSSRVRRPRSANALGALALAFSLACGGVKGPVYSLDLSAATLAFTAEQNGELPAAQTISGTFQGDGILVGYPPDVAPPGWLSVRRTGASGRSITISVAIGTTSLPPGMYRTTLRFVTGKEDGSQLVIKDVAVEYAVTAGLQVTPTTLIFSAVDGLAPAQQSIRLTSSAQSEAWALSVEAVAAGATDWLSLSSPAGTLTSGSVEVQVGAAARPPGSYAATVVVRNGAGGIRARIPVSYQVAPAFTLGGPLSARVTEMATRASLDLPLSLHSQVDAASGAGHGWKATSSADWLTVLPESGDLAADALLTVRLDPARLWALPNGSHGATITVTSSEGGSTTATATVALTVALAPALAAPESVYYSLGAGATAADVTRTVAVSSNLGEAFADRGRWHATSSTPWLQATPASAAGGPSLRIDVVPAALAAVANGAQTGTVTIQPDDARVGGAAVRANLLLALPGVDHVAPYATWVGRAPTVILRGSGFGNDGTLPVRIGSEVATGTVISDTELRVTAPAQAAAARVPVRVENALGVARSASELVILPAPAYASHQASLTTYPTQMTLDPERQAVLLGGSGTEIHRFRFASGAWVEDAFQAPSATAAYVALDGQTLLVTSGNTGSPANVFLELDPDTFAIRKTTGYPTYYARFDMVAGFNDGRVLVIDSEQWVETIWYPSLAKGLYIDAWNPRMLLTRDRSRMIVTGMGLSSYDVADSAAKARSIASSPYQGYDWSVSGDGGRFVVGAAVYDRDFAFRGSVSLPETYALAVAVSPGGDSLYTLARTSANSPWIFRRASIAGAGPYAAEATPLPFSIDTSEYPVAMAVSEDGGTLFLLTRGSSSGRIFRALPL